MSLPVGLVVSGFLSAVVDCAAAKAVSYLQSNFDLPRGTSVLLETLRDNLTMVKAITEEADKRLITNPNQIEWLKRLHVAAQEAEDVLDEFEVDKAVAGKRKVSDFVSSSFRTLKKLIMPDEYMIRLENVVRTIDQLCARSGTFLELMKLSQAKQQAENLWERETSSHLPVDVEVFGRDEVREWILKMIVGSSDDEAGSSTGGGKIGARDRVCSIDVLPIVGMSGAGKTTLAQVIYNHGKVKEHFAQRAWVYVSEYFSLKRTLQEILRSFEGNYSCFDNADSLDAIVTKLHRVISQHGRFLLVLDNIWDEVCKDTNIIIWDKKNDDWKILLTAIVTEAPGSVILVTTQSQRVAQFVGTICPILLKALAWEHFWPLFQCHAFGSMEVAQQANNQSMLLIGEEIAKKLDGLPLAARVIGNLLRSRFAKDKWIRIAQSDWWNLDEALHAILPYLGVSYQHLSPRQRQCFAYCSIFPKNYLFDRDRVVQMWIANDFIQHSELDGTRLEDVGRQCFDELVERSLFQPTFDSNKFVMHDLVRGLSIAVSLNQCFLHSERSAGASPRPNVRHLALQADNVDHFYELHKYKNLRTLLLFGHFESDAIFDVLESVLGNSRSLRVLDLSYVEAQRNEWPKAKAMRKLQFLDLSFTRIRMLRDFPCTLQVLHLRGYCSGSLPQSITMLTSLRHLYVDASALSLISGIGQLTKLQELENFSARKGREGFMINELKNMQELTGQLCISSIHNVRSKEEAMEARLMDKKHVDALVLKGTKVPKFVLEGLQPHPNIQELTIKGYGGRDFPNWMLQPNDFTNLLCVHLEDCRFLDTLPPLGHLSSLKILSLQRLPSIKHVDGVSLGGFPSLEELKISSVEAWEEWSEPDEDAHGLLLPRLTSLHLEYCSSLKEVPFLPFLSTLSNLEITKPGDYITAIPSCLQVLASLITLKITYCNHLVALSAHQLKSLENLVLMQSDGLRLIDGFQCFGNLRTAYVEGCPGLLSELSDPECLHVEHVANLLTSLTMDESLMTGNYFLLGKLPSLHHLRITSLTLAQFSEEQEAAFQHLTSLEFIGVMHCYTLKCLPAPLATLPSIKILHISRCHQLHELPKHVVSPRLQELLIDACSPELESRTDPENGADWPNIAHVPYIRVEGRTIQNR